MALQALNNLVILEVPEDVWYSQKPDGTRSNIKLTKPSSKGVDFPVVSVGELVNNLKVGDKVRLDTRDHNIAIMDIDGKEMMMVQSFEIDIKVTED